MESRFQIDAEACILGALLLLTLPAGWLLAAAAAAAVHECCHAAAIFLLGGRLRSLRVGICGAVMDAQIPGTRQELLSAAAGPAGSLLLLLLFHVYPKLAVCALVQGVFNLLPLYPLDGGRMLRCGLMLASPENAERIQIRVETFFLVILLLLALAWTWLFSWGLFPLIAVLLTIRRILRNKPCKRSQIGVQ